MPYKDPEKARENRRKYYQANREKRILYSQMWSEKNRERSNETKRRYVRNNPEKRKISWSKYNQSAKGRQKKHIWYRKWVEKLGVRTWNEWILERQSLAKYKEYPAEFNKKLKTLIRKRDGYVCQSCGMIEPLSKILLGKSLNVHHKDYDRKNCSPNNLVTLCFICNIKANFYREYWKVKYGIKKPVVFVVIPTIRENAIKTFLSVWKKELQDTTILVIEDNPTKSFDLGKHSNIVHFCHKDIERDLGDKSWIIPRKTSAICSYGFYKAYKMGADVTIKMDDDLLVRKEGFIKSHVDNIFTTRPLHWVNIFKGYSVYPRGFPYKERTHITVLNYGLAENILDMDASGQILGLKAELSDAESINVGYGSYFPISGMNVSFLTEITPAYYFTLQGKSWGIDRFDDIWAGIFLKKITDHIGHVISVGHPIITHNKLSDPLANLDKEAGGLDINELLWEEVDRIKLTKYTYKDCYLEIARKLNLPISGYGDKLKEAMKIWASLFIKRWSRSYL